MIEIVLFVIGAINLGLHILSGCITHNWVKNTKVKKSILFIYGYIAFVIIGNAISFIISDNYYERIKQYSESSALDYLSIAWIFLPFGFKLIDIIVTRFFSKHLSSK